MRILLRRHVRLRRGLTLVDYIMSVAVIAVLAAILFPVFAQAREEARKSSCRTNLHQIGLALHLYARDHDGRLPPGRYLTPLLGTYVPSVTAFRCPSESDGIQIGASKIPTRARGGLTWKNGRAVVPTGLLYCSYQYQGGLTLDSPADTRVAGDWSFLHQTRAMTLNLAGEVRPLTREQWKAYALAPGLPKGPGNSSNDNATPFLPEPRGRNPEVRPAAGESALSPWMPGMPGGGNGP